MLKKMAVALMISALPFSAALAASGDKEHPPQKATDKATPEMKNPGGSENLHPPQKAMDEATPTEKSTDGASSGASGSAGASAGQASQAKFPDWDMRKAGESVELKGGKTE